MNPYKLREIYKYLTRAKKTQPDLPDVFPASKAPIPPVREDVETIEAINRFNKANPRQDMAGGGMLVQPSADGSRPGYSKSKMGESKLGEGMENIYKEKIGPGKFRYSIQVSGKKYGQAIGEKNLPTLKKKRDQVIKELYPNRITNEDFAKLKNLKKYENMSSVEFSKVLNDRGFTTISGKEWNPKSTLRKIDELDLELVGRARSEDEIFEIVKKLEGGPSKIKLYKEGIISLETLRDIANDYEKRQSPEFKETKKKIDTKANLKRAQELGNFPPGANPNDNLWAQVYRAAKDGDGRWKIVSKLPSLKDGKRDWVKNGDWKKMKVIDTQTGTEFGYKDLKSYLDNLEGPGTYDEALKPWQNKKDLNAIKINYRGNTISLGKVLSNKKIEKEFFEKTGKFPKGVDVEEINKFFKKKYPYGKSSFAVNHPEGVKINWWKGEAVHKDANDRLERLDKSFRASLNSAQNNVQRNKVIELYKKDVKNIGNVTSVFEGQTIGKSNLFSAAKDAFKAEGLIKTFSANKANILSAFCNSRKKLNTGSGSLTCSMEEIQTNMKKQINEAARASKDGKIPKRFGKLRAVAGGFFGDVALPLEYLFMAPDLVAGDIDGALRSSTAGLFGAGKVDLEQLPPGEGRKYIRHTNAITNFLNNYQSKMMAEDQLKNLKPGDEEQFVVSDQLAQAEKNMADIVKDYQGFGYTYQPGEKGLLEGKVAAQKLIRDKVTSDFDKKIDKGASTEFFKDKYRETGDLLKENLRSLGGDPFTVTPINNLEDYIKNKGEATAGNTNIFFNRLPYTLEQAEAYGVPDIFNTYAGGYAGVETPGSMEKGQEIDMGIKDVRDAYSSLPINMASQLADLEKKEFEEGMLERRLENQLFAGGGIAKIAGIDQGPPPVRGPNSTRVARSNETWY
jgi:hypothetical protein